MAEPPNPDPTDDTDLAEAEEAALREAAELTDGHEPGDSVNLQPDDPIAVQPAPKARPARPVTAAAATSPKKTPARAPRKPPAETRAAAPASPPPDQVTTAVVPGEVRADSVIVSQGGVGFANATSVDVRQGGIGRVEARDVAVTMGGIGIARGESVSVEMGGIGAAFATDVRISKGGVNAVVAREAHVEQSFVQTVLAERVVFQRPSGVVFLIARRVEGNVRALFDWRGAAAFGAAFGVIVSLLRRRR
ncbi:MAG: hypothetical protein WEF51_00575 [Chloroflexota bacterium]